MSFNLSVTHTNIFNDDVSTLSYIPINKTNEDRVYIIYAGKFI